MAATNLFILIEGGVISDMAADGSIEVHTIDADNAKVGEPNTEQWSLVSGERFKEMQRMYEKAIESETINRECGHCGKPFEDGELMVSSCAGDSHEECCLKCATC